MQGIPFAEFKKLLSALSNIRQHDIIHLREDQLQTVIDNEEKLKEIYSRYQMLIKQLSENVVQFENQKLVIRKLMKDYRHYVKDKEKIAVPVNAG